MNRFSHSFRLAVPVFMIVMMTVGFVYAGAFVFGIVSGPVPLSSLPATIGSGLDVFTGHMSPVVQSVTGPLADNQELLAMFTLLAIAGSLLFAIPDIRRVAEREQEHGLARGIRHLLSGALFWISLVTIPALFIMQQSVPTTTAVLVLATTASFRSVAHSRHHETS